MVAWSRGARPSPLDPSPLRRGLGPPCPTSPRRLPTAAGDPGRCGPLRSDLETQVGTPTVLKALTVLSSILSLATVREAIPRNPVSAIRKPRQGTSRRVRPLPPETVERLRALLSPRDARWFLSWPTGAYAPQRRLGCDGRTSETAPSLSRAAWCSGRSGTPRRAGRERSGCSHR